MLITHWWCSCCWAVLTGSQGLSSISYCPASRSLGVEEVREGWGGIGREGEGRATQLGQLIPTDQKYIPYHMTSLSADELEGKLSVGLILRKWLGVGQLVVSNFFFHFCHFFFVCFFYLSIFLIFSFLLQSLSLFCFNYYTIINWNHKFSHFYPSCFLPHPTRGEWVSSFVHLSCQLGLSHDIWHWFIEIIQTSGPSCLISCPCHWQLL